MASDIDAPEGGMASGGVIRVGTWNMSHWALHKLDIIQRELGVDLLALQETHLALDHLRLAHAATRRVGWRLYHGRDVPVAAGGWGRSCGVGFLAAPGVAIQPALPVGAAWRRLHAICRLHAVRLAPRPGLPAGMLLLSVYAPVQGHAAQLERAQFNAAFMELVHGLDMQTPTILLGD